MSNGIEEKFTAFCQWVQDITGRPVMKARRHMNTQLKVPYCSVDLLTAPLVAKDLVLYRDKYPDTVSKTLTERVRGLVLATFQITALGGDDAMQCIHRLSASFKTDAWLVFAKKNSFGTAGADGMENIASEFLGAAYENRAQMKATFYIPVPVDFDEDYFTYGQITTTVNNITSKNVTVDQYGVRYDQ